MQGPAELPSDRKRGEAGCSGSPAEPSGDRKRGKAGRSGSPAEPLVGKVLSCLTPLVVSAMCPSCSTAASHCCVPALTRHHPTDQGRCSSTRPSVPAGTPNGSSPSLPGLRLIGVDRDPTALDIVRARLARFTDRLTLVQARYDGIDAALAESGYGPTESVDGMLFDLGVSSMQLDRRERGFSYAHDAPLDMRMDPTSALTAAEIVNSYDETALTDILRRYGEERLARRIASHIVRRRARAPFTSTGDLVEVLYQAIPAPARRTGGHPAKRTFQALRIAVNGELEALRSAMPAALDAMAVDGRIVVLAYQSLEDRIVKRVFAEATTSSTPSDLPVELPGHAPQFTSLTRGAERAGDAEIRAEPAECCGATACPTTRATETRGSEEGRLMKANREAKPPRGGDRRRGQNNASRNAGRRAADPTPARRNRPRAGKATAPAREPRMSRSAPQTTPIARPVDRPARPKSANQAKARCESAESQGAQSRSATSAGTSAQPAGVDRPTAANLGGQSPVRSAGHRFARRRARPHVVAVHRRCRAFLSAWQCPSADAVIAAAKGSARTGRAGGTVRAGIGRGRSRPGDDPDEGHRTFDPGSRGELGGRRHPQAGPRGSAAAAEHQAARRKADVALGSAGEFG